MFAVNIKIYAAISHLAALNLSSQSLDHVLLKYLDHVEALMNHLKLKL